MGDIGDIGGMTSTRGISSSGGGAGRSVTGMFWIRGSTFWISVRGR